MRQFVIETTLIAVAGGTVGLLVGVSLSRAIASFAGWSTIISSGSLALAFSVSVLIGLVSGVYPAMKASRAAATSSGWPWAMAAAAMTDSRACSCAAAGSRSNAPPLSAAP